MTTPGDKEEGLKPGILVGSEDCLALDIYAPADAGGKALPVMVWIHGGYSVWSRSGSYDGSRLAQAGDVIVVAVQYRLGPLGWFAHPFVRDSARDPEDAAASFATLDMIASPRCAGSGTTSAPSAATRATSRSSARAPVATTS